MFKAKKARNYKKVQSAVSKWPKINKVGLFMMAV
jgi:hypothetical protein